MSISWPHHSMAIPRHSHGSMIAWRYHGNSATIACHQHDTLSRRNGSFYVLHHGLARKNAVHRPRTRARKKGILTQRSLYKNAVHPLRTRSNKIKSDAPRRQGSGSRGVGHVSARAYCSPASSSSSSSPSLPPAHRCFGSAAAHPRSVRKIDAPAGTGLPR